MEYVPQGFVGIQWNSPTGLLLLEKYSRWRLSLSKLWLSVDLDVAGDAHADTQGIAGEAVCSLS